MGSSIISLNFDQLFNYAVLAIGRENKDPGIMLSLARNTTKGVSIKSTNVSVSSFPKELGDLRLHTGQ